MMAIRLAEKIRATLAAEPFEQVDQITVSIGVAQYQPDMSARLWVQQADMALYQAKENGRNQVAAAPQVLPDNTT